MGNCVHHAEFCQVLTRGTVISLGPGDWGTREGACGIEFFAGNVLDCIVEVV